MASKLELYNAALVLVSTETMKTELEDTPHGNAARALFPSRYEALLGQGAWPFALKRASLSGISSPP